MATRNLAVIGSYFVSLMLCPLIAESQHVLIVFTGAPDYDKTRLCSRTWRRTLGIHDCVNSLPNNIVWGSMQLWGGCLACCQSVWWWVQLVSIVFNCCCGIGTQSLDTPWPSTLGTCETSCSCFATMVHPYYFSISVTHCQSLIYIACHFHY